MEGTYDLMANTIAVAFSAVYVVIVLVIGVLTLLAHWKIFVKAGKPGWACIIPFYNTYCMFEITFGNGWLFLLACVPCVNIVVTIMMLFKLANAFGKGTGFGFGLLFLNTIFILILGLGSAQYLGVPEKN